MVRNVERAEAVADFVEHPVDTVVDAHKRVIAEVEEHEARGEYFSSGMASGEMASGDAAVVIGTASGGAALVRLARGGLGAVVSRSIFTDGLVNPYSPQALSETFTLLSEGSCSAIGEGTATALVIYDYEFAAQQILGERPFTPGGRTIIRHAAEQMVEPPRGRVPMSIQEVDQVLDTATRVRKITDHPKGYTVTLQRPDLPGRPQVVVDAATGERVVTVIKNRPRNR